MFVTFLFFEILFIYCISHVFEHHYTKSQNFGTKNEKSQGERRMPINKIY